MLSPWTQECPCKGLPENTLTTTIGPDGINYKIVSVGLDLAKGPDQCVSTTETHGETISKEEERIVNEVIKGKWGNGQFRRYRLERDGYDWRHIQNLVNEKLGCDKRYVTDKCMIGR